MLKSNVAESPNPARPRQNFRQPKSLISTITMRLLDTTTFPLKSFDVRDDRPPYAILSHAWGLEGSEVLYEDVRDIAPRVLPEKVKKTGVAKVVGTCALAKKDGFAHVWIDTCCIDKSSSAELSEAINTMFEWYSDAAICYAYLADVERSSEVETLATSRWFERGWTLQELIAPKAVGFYDKSWEPLGSRKELAKKIEGITGIKKHLLQRHGIRAPDVAMHKKAMREVQDMLATISVATRMSWAAKRKTTREEDIAYCLLGVFGVHMPLLYGEGGENAFVRLQRQIVQSTPYDQSILAWTTNDSETRVQIFSPSPRGFVEDVSIFPRSRITRDLTPTSNGLQVDVLLGRFPNSDLSIIRDGMGDLEMLRYRDPHCYVAVVDFARPGSFLSRPALLVRKLSVENRTLYIKLVNGIVWLGGPNSSGAPFIEGSLGSSFRVTSMLFFRPRSNLPSRRLRSDQISRRATGDAGSIPTRGHHLSRHASCRTNRTLPAADGVLF